MNGPVFFANPDVWREWLESHHGDETEVIVGFYKKGSGIPGMSWPESVDEALCFGWIDGVRKGIDDERYQIRFTPRKRTSIWSSTNIERMRVLTEEGRVSAAGLAAFEQRKEGKSSVYSYENEIAELPPEAAARFRANEKAWAFFQSQAPSYQRTCIWWVLDAKKRETQESRLASLIEDSEAERKGGTYKRSDGSAWSDKPSAKPHPG